MVTLGRGDRFDPITVMVAERTSMSGSFRVRLDDWAPNSLIINACTHEVQPVCLAGQG